MKNREHWVIYPSVPLSLEGVVIIESRSVRSSSPRLCESAWARQLLELLLRLSLLLLRTFSLVSLLSCTGAVSAKPEPKPANGGAGGFMAKASAVKRLMCMNVNEVLVTKLQDKMVFTTQRVIKTFEGDRHLPGGFCMLDRCPDHVFTAAETSTESGWILHGQNIWKWRQLKNLKF